MSDHLKPYLWIETLAMERHPDLRWKVDSWDYEDKIGLGCRMTNGKWRGFEYLKTWATNADFGWVGASDKVETYDIMDLSTFPNESDRTSEAVRLIDNLANVIRSKAPHTDGSGDAERVAGAIRTAIDDAVKRHEAKG